jgi:hypothetical protein
MAQGAASAAIAFMQAKEGARSRLSREPPPRSRRRRSRSASTGDRPRLCARYRRSRGGRSRLRRREAELGPVSRIDRPDRVIGGKGPALLVSRLASARLEGALVSCIGQLPFPQAQTIAAESGVLRSASCRARTVSRGATSRIRPPQRARSARFASSSRATPSASASVSRVSRSGSTASLRQRRQTAILQACGSPRAETKEDSF